MNLPTDQLDHLAFRMFRQFARMEYALKAARHLKTQSGRADPCWQHFATSIDGAFRELLGREAALRESAAWMNRHPPKRQMVDDGRLYWDDAAITSKTETGILLDHVKRVRNNLFHGGKFNGVWFEPQRSEELLQHSLVILDGCLQVAPDVRAAYSE